MGRYHSIQNQYDAYRYLAVFHCDFDTNILTSTHILHCGVIPHGSAHCSQWNEWRSQKELDGDILSNISNTRRCVSSGIQTLRSRLKTRGAAECFFKRLGGVWISDETHFRVFDMASQMINHSWRNSRLNMAKCYQMVIRNIYPIHGHSSDFPCFLLMNY